MSVITRVPEPNLWEEICKEFRNRAKPEVEDDQTTVVTECSDFTASRHHPAFYGNMHAKVEADGDGEGDLDPAKSHPACMGYAFTDKPPKSQEKARAPLPNKDKSTPRQYLEAYVFPILLPALEAMLRQAKIEKCFERKRTKFNALDFITEYLYRRNTKFSDRGETELWDIPFVKEWLKDHPRPPLPLSLLWTEEEAALIIQSYWRGYLVRRAPEVQELRQWQREWREINGNIHRRVSDFWDSKIEMPPSSGEGEPPSSLSVNYRPQSPIPESTTPTSGIGTAPPSRISAPSANAVEAIEEAELSTLNENSGLE